MLIRIVAPHFVAGVEVLEFENRVPPIIAYMRPWFVWDIIDYCHRKRWEVEVFDV